MEFVSRVASANHDERGNVLNSDYHEDQLDNDEDGSDLAIVNSSSYSHFRRRLIQAQLRDTAVDATGDIANDQFDAALEKVRATD